MRRMMTTVIPTVLIGLSLVLLTACKAQVHEINNTVTIPLDECPYPLEMAKPPKVNATLCDGKVCLPKPEMEALVAYIHEIKRWADDALASLDFCNRQIDNNNTRPGGTTDGAPLSTTN